MIPRAARFNFSHRFPKNKYTSPLFVLRYEQTPEQPSKIAIIVSKKVDKRATIRNLLKRRFSQVLMKTLKNSQKSFTILVYVRAASKDVSFQKLSEEIDRSFSAIHDI